MAARTLFEHLNHILSKKSTTYWEELSPPDRSSFSVFMINRFLSMDMRFINIVNASQQYNLLDGRTSYLFLSHAIPMGYKVPKYIKAGKKTDLDWLYDHLAFHYKISMREAREYVQLFCSTETGKEILSTLIRRYERDPKKLEMLSEMD